MCSVFDTFCPVLDTLLTIPYNSQGTAVVAYALAGLPECIRLQIDAVVLFAYTQNEQLQGAIPGYPSERLKVFCNEGDLLCEGQLVVTPAHFTYTEGEPQEAASFIKDVLEEADSDGGW